MNLRSVSLCAILLLGYAGSVSAQAVKLEFVGGLVNLTVQNAPARVVLAEWARLGGTQMVNGNNVTGAPLTLELIGVAERYALEVILRGVPGYIVSNRQSPGVGGASAFDRVMIMPTTRAVAPAGGATFGAPVQRPPVFETGNDEPTDVTTIQRVQEQRAVAEAARRAAEEAAGRVVVTGQPVVGQPGSAVVIRPGGAPQPFFPDPAPAAAPPPAQPGAGQPARPTNPFAPTPVPPAQDGRPATTPQR
jgi:hypothetical protein